MKNALRTYHSLGLLKSQRERVESQSDLFDIDEELKNKAIESINNQIAKKEGNYLCNVLTKPSFTDKEIHLLNEMLTY
ncbi:MAG: hypothetical protein RL728_1144 [Bacteroidota bacterium]|jgi:hypothetical protein